MKLFSFLFDKQETLVLGDLGVKLEVRKIKDKYVLNAENVNYSFGGLHHIFQEAFKRIDIQSLQPKTVLILGFGAGSVASILQNELKIECDILGVEKDAKVIELAKKYFNLEQYQNLSLMEDDAFGFVEHNKQKFDLIVVDVYNDFRVPENIESLEFLKNIKSAKAENGFLIFNKVVYNLESEAEAKILENKFKQVFGQVTTLNIKHGLTNKMFVVS
jgi:spermidine synthase